MGETGPMSRKCLIAFTIPVFQDAEKKWGERGLEFIGKNVSMIMILDNQNRRERSKQR
jgi:hypothetical protein